MTKQKQEFEFPPMQVLDRKTKELIKTTISAIVVRICMIYKFKNELPKSTLNKEIKELYNSVMSLQSMYFKQPREYYKFVEKYLNSIEETIVLQHNNTICDKLYLSDILDLHALASVCSHVFDSTDILGGAMTCTTGNKLLKLIKFRAPKA